MKKSFLKYTIAAYSALFVLSCTKMDDIGILNDGGYAALDNSMPLKNAAAFPIGTAISPGPFNNEAKYREIVLRDFSSVTFEYHMKHGAIVKEDGSKDFSAAHNMISNLNGIPVFGHTLAWHQNQNATFLNTTLGLASAEEPEELLQNGNFEAGNINPWGAWNNAGGAAEVGVTSNSAYVYDGTYSLRVMNPVNGNPWGVQIASNQFATEAGENYRVTFAIRTESGAGQMRLSTNNDNGADYQGDVAVTNAWQTVVWNFTGRAGLTRIMIDIGSAAGTYYLDNFSVVQVPVPVTGPELAAKVDSLLKDFIIATVTEFKADVRAWDVVNEIFNDEGAIRNAANTPTPDGASDFFLWSGYLGKELAYSAFRYAEEADPTADLYINDYNLELHPRKVDSLISLVNELKQRGAKIDGIGTQMHINWRTDLGKMEDMFRKLGQTGLKIRISELDIRTVMTSAAGGPTPLLNSYQAAMAKDVVELYIKHIPPAQRAGITIWGVNDGNSWISNNGAEFALFYDDNYEKKPAYGAFLHALLNNQ